MGELRLVRRTSHFDEGCRFYGETLGWPITREWGEPNPGRIFGYGESARVELISDETDTPVTGALVAIEVDDVDAVHDTIISAGLEPVQPLADQPWGHRNFGVIDPTGMTLVFFEVVE